MARADFPLCIYCNNSEHWHLERADGYVEYVCLSCGHSVEVQVSNG